MLGREIELFVPDVDKLSPESCRQAIAACIDKKVHAISNAFLFAPIPAMDESAKYKCPYLQGNTQRNATLAYKADPKKYSHVLQTDPSEVNYGWTYPLWLTKMEETGVWKPKNRKIHIVAEQVGYCQTILKAARESIPKYNFELAEVTDIQYPVNDWSPVIQKLKEVDAGAIMIDHWVAAEYAAFCKQFSADPVPGAIVYLQYGPSQPEFLRAWRIGHRGLLLEHGARRLWRRDRAGFPRRNTSSASRNSSASWASSIPATATTSSSTSSARGKRRRSRKISRPTASGSAKIPIAASAA